MRWQMLDIPSDHRTEKFKLVVRLNSLGSLYFFEKYTLGKTDMSPHFHKPILERVGESDVLRYLIELPRDHFKTTMITEGRTMWRSLPFTEADEVAMRELGYDDAWIAWMHRAHNAGRRTLIVSEVLANAIKIGFRIDWHFQENQIFRHVFSDIIPDAKCIWNNECKQVRAPERGANGEGTFDFLGVGGALQSRHYHDIVEDDVIGKDAIESELIMQKTIDYHRLLIGAFVKFRTGAWTVVNNRWAPNDLSGWIRENNKKVAENKRFVIEHHGALGGCCEDHPAGQPVFPELVTLEDLEEIRQTQGPYYFSHQFLNLPVAPEECIFKPEWLRFYASTPSPIDASKRWIHHETKEGETIPDINPNGLIRSMVIDPNHAEEKGRSRHAIVVTGFDPETDRIYLLDYWAGSRSYDELAIQVFKLAKMWGLNECWVENIAGQRLLRYPLQYRQKVENFALTVRFDLKTDRGANAKRDRIESLEPIYRQGQFWCRHDQGEFIDEYCGYPGHPTKDILDAIGYSTQTWNAIHARRINDIIQKRKERHNHRKTRTGY